MKKTNTALLVLIAILFVAVLYLLYLNFNKTPITNTLIPRTSIVPTTDQTPTISTVNSTANWKTYENKQYGFEFKYPENQFSKSNPIVATPNGCQKLDNTGCVNPERYEFYVVKSCGNGECTNIIGLTVFPDPNSPTFKRDSTDMTGANSLTTIINSTVGGLPAKKRSYGSLEDVYGPIYYVTTDKYSYVIYGNPNDSVFNQILSTFKFTESATTSLGNWTKRTNGDFQTNCLWINTAKAVDNGNLEQYVKNYYQTDSLDSFLNPVKYTVKNKETITISAQGIGELFTVYFPKDDKKYSITFSVASQDDILKTTKCQSYKDDINFVLNNPDLFL